MLIEDYFQIKIPTIFANQSGDAALAHTILSFKDQPTKNTYRYKMWLAEVKPEEYKHGLEGD